MNTAPLSWQQLKDWPVLLPRWGRSIPSATMRSAIITGYLNAPTEKRGCDKMVNHFVAASFLRLYFIIFSSAVSLLRKNARKPFYPHKTFNYIVLGGNPYTHYFCDVFP